MSDSKPNIKNLQLISFWSYLSRRRKKQFYMLLILMILASFAEMISLGAVLPFLGAMIAPDQVYQHQLMQPFIQLLELTEPSQLIFPLTVLFIVVSIFAGIIRLTLLYVLTRLSFATGADISIDIYRRTLYQEYAIHLTRNSSEIINGITKKTDTVIGTVQAILTLISSIILLIGIMIALGAVDIKTSLIAFTGFGLLYWVVVRYTRVQIKDNSQEIADKSTEIIKSLQEGLGGIRDVLIDGTQQFYCDLYRSADLPLRRASGNNMFINGSPRYVMESIGMSLIAVLAYIMTLQQDKVTMIIPVLGVMALGAQRLLPALQQAYGSYSRIMGDKSSFKDVLDLLGQSLPGYINENQLVAIPFKKEIQINNLSFCYTNDMPWVLNNVNLTITKGERIGFMGVTGSGKSTLLDIIMGLLLPTKGEIAIDGHPITIKNKRAWQLNIAHVPQNIYLSDSTIEENIAFGIPKDKIDRKQVEEAAKHAQIAESIDSWREGYHTFVGEQGVRLSGGQRQRIGIARALYKNANVLIFDEATSALDNETEIAVMEAIEGLGEDLTILIIAHRLSTLKNCDRVLKLDKNNEIFVGTYQEVVSG